MGRAERIRIDADARASAPSWKAVLSARRAPPATANVTLMELGRVAGYPIPQLAQDKPVEPGTRTWPGKLVVRHSSGGEAIVPHGREAIQGI